MTHAEIIAEIGINHNGDIEIAKKLVNIAALAGATSVKFQKRNPDICVPEEQKMVLRQTAWGEMTYIEYKHRMEFQKPEYDILNDHCREQGIDWFFSVWDEDSVAFANDYPETKSIKIPSALLTDHYLIRLSAETGKRMILSTGMSTFEEISAAVRVLEKFKPRNAPKPTIMHCNSSYPAQVDELNLSCIRTLKQAFPDYDIGYSGHEYGLMPSIMAVSLGAVSIERHITLNRAMVGTDHLASVEPIGLMKLCAQIRSLEKAIGDGRKLVYESEQPSLKKMRLYRDENGAVVGT